MSAGGPAVSPGVVGFVHHESSLRHEMPPGHPERAERIAAITAHLEECGLLDTLDRHCPGPAEMDDLALAHDAAYLELLAEIDAAGGGRLDLDTSMSPHSFGATRHATQGAIDAVARVLDGTWTSAFVCARPPGHHATPFRAMGFCLTNHIAIAARWATARRGLDRVVILDWDAHHGNGTQDAFWTASDVLYISLHQYPWYPGTGDATERGEGDGVGRTVNVPLPAGAGEDAYTEAFHDVIEPVVSDFDPQLVLVSAGYDAHHHDPLCMMRLTAGAFGRMTDRVKEWGPGPVFVLEGGYDLDALRWGTAATLSSVLGTGAPVGVPDGERDAIAGVPHAIDWVERAAALHDAS